MFFDYNEIVPNRLWVGACIVPDDARQLHRLGVTTVVSLQSDVDLKTRGINIKKLVQALEEMDIDYRRMPVQDFSKELLLEKLPECVSALEEIFKPGWAKVYLHCTAGINRSPTVAAAYLMKTHGWEAQDAFDYLTHKRDCQPYLDVLEQYRDACLMVKEFAFYFD